VEQPVKEVEAKGEMNGKVYDDCDKDIAEQSVGTIERTDAEIKSDTGSESLGKFKDVESLMKAYNSLQAEFTKKSQRLSELEGERKPHLQQEKINATIDELFKKYSIAEPFKAKLKDNLADLDSDDIEKVAEQNLIKLLAENFKTPEEMVMDKEFLANFIFNNNEVKETIIKEYLDKLKTAKNVKLATNLNSSIPASPPKTVKTISEAGSIAKSIIKKV